MLIPVISFEIRDFANNTFEEFTVENTQENYEMIASHRFTRDIKFDNVFDFAFSRVEKVPTFILFGHAVADAFEKNESVMNICHIDEMCGTY